MKRIRSALCLSAFLLVLCVLVQFSLAVDEIANGNETVTTMPNTNSSPTTMAPPDSLTTAVKRSGSNQENRSKGESEANVGKDQTKGSNVKDNVKDQKIESSTEKKDAPLEKPKSEDSNGKESANTKSLDNTVSEGDSLIKSCDPSSRCEDEKNKLIACLRVPGGDSLDLSLLIQNKGEGVLNVDIITPDAVKLEETSVILKGKENKEVKVSVDGVVIDTAITLKAGDGSCKLSYSSMIPNLAHQTSRMTKYMNLVKHSSFTTVLLAAGAILVALVFFIRLWRMRRQEGISHYQKVDMTLPISTGGIKKDSDETDGWDDNWGDDWDDEETPKTPTTLVSTPSSKGLASRKSNKDGWKD